MTITLQLQNLSDDVTTDVSEGLKAGVPAKWKHQTVVCTVVTEPCPEANIVSKTPYRHVTSDGNGRAIIEVPRRGGLQPGDDGTPTPTPILWPREIPRSTCGTSRSPSNGPMTRRRRRRPLLSMGR